MFFSLYDSFTSLDLYTWLTLVFRGFFFRTRFIHFHASSSHTIRSTRFSTWIIYHVILPTLFISLDFCVIHLRSVWGLRDSFILGLMFRPFFLFCTWFFISCLISLYDSFVFTAVFSLSLYPWLFFHTACLFLYRDPCKWPVLAARFHFSLVIFSHE